MVSRRARVKECGRARLSAWPAAARAHTPPMVTPFARASIAAARSLRARGGGGGGRPFWSEGTQAGGEARLFNESPPPAGARRKWESWEAIWCA